MFLLPLFVITINWRRNNTNREWAIYDPFHSLFSFWRRKIYFFCILLQNLWWLKNPKYILLGDGIRTCRVLNLFKRKAERFLRRGLTFSTKSWNFLKLEEPPSTEGCFKSILDLLLVQFSVYIISGPSLIELNHIMNIEWLKLSHLIQQA